jgi:hypothetical protein
LELFGSIGGNVSLDQEKQRVHCITIDWTY